MNKPTLQNAPPILNADTYWVHLLKDMVHSGEAAKIGPYALAVYVVIKAHANMAGSSLPSRPSPKTGYERPPSPTTTEDTD
jgi:hypothetical protein